MRKQETRGAEERDDDEERDEGEFNQGLASLLAQSFSQ